MQELDTGLQRIYDKNGIVRGRLRLAGNWTMCGGYLPHRIKEFNQLRPEVTHFTRFLLTSDILRYVQNSSIHLGFCGDFVQDEYPEIERHHLFTENMVLIVPLDHPLASRQEVLFSELRSEAFISFKMINSGGAYEALIELCTKYGFTPNIVYEMTDDHAIVSTVQIGLGIALVPQNECLPLNGVAIVPIKDEHPIRHQYMIWKKNSYLPPIARAFRDYIIQYEETSRSGQA